MSGMDVDTAYQKALEVLAQKYKVSYKAGETLFREGDRENKIYFVISGMVNVYIGEGAKKRSLWILQEGSIFGEMSLLDDLPRTASVEAEADTDLVVLDRETFFGLISKYPSLAVKIIQLMGRSMRKMDAQFKVESGYRKTK